MIQTPSLSQCAFQTSHMWSEIFYQVERDSHWEGDGPVGCFVPVTAYAAYTLFPTAIQIHDDGYPQIEKCLIFLSGYLIRVRDLDSMVGHVLHRCRPCTIDSEPFASFPQTN